MKELAKIVDKSKIRRERFEACKGLTINEKKEQPVSTGYIFLEARIQLWFK